MMSSSCGEIENRIARAPVTSAAVRMPMLESPILVSMEGAQTHVLQYLCYQRKHVRASRMCPELYARGCMW